MNVPTHAAAKAQQALDASKSEEWDTLWVESASQSFLPASGVLRANSANSSEANDPVLCEEYLDKRKFRAEACAQIAVKDLRLLDLKVPVHCTPEGHLDWSSQSTVFSLNETASFLYLSAASIDIELSGNAAPGVCMPASGRPWMAIRTEFRTEKSKLQELLFFDLLCMSFHLCNVPCTHVSFASAHDGMQTYS